MLRTLLSCLILGLLLVSAVPKPIVAQQRDRQASTVEEIKIAIAKLGVGAKAKATIRLKDGTKNKGYVAQAGEDNFVMRDRKTDAPTTIRYADVSKVEENRGHSTARNIAIGVTVGAGAVIAVLALLIASLD
ncbi:MAG: hypothetical protein ACR2G5_01825 [Pyrinomonadaceae bacterium]